MRLRFLVAAASVVLAAVPGAAVAYEGHQMTAEEQARYDSMTEEQRQQAAAQYNGGGSHASAPEESYTAPPAQSTSAASTTHSEASEGTYTHEDHDGAGLDENEEEAARQAGLTLEKFREIRDRIQEIIDRFNEKREAALAELRAEIEAVKGDFVGDKETIVLECATAQGWDVELVRSLLHGEITWNDLTEEQRQAFLEKRESFEQCVRDRCQGDIGDAHDRVRAAEERAREKIEQAMREAMAEWEALKAELGLA